MSQVFKRGKAWSARIQWTDDDGKRCSKSQSAFPTKALANKWVIEQKAKLNKGVQIDKEISLVDYYEQWFNTYKKEKLADITINRYVYTGNALKKFFKDTNIKNIKRSDYQKFINWYGANHAPVTVKKVNSIIRSCVKSAILDDYLFKDFTQRVELSANKSKVIKVDYLNLDEIKSLVKGTTKNIELRPGFTSRFMIITAIYTGMRLSEIQALTWKDIDFLHQAIDINKSWNMKQKDFKPTKNESSNRIIKVNTELLHYLKILRDHRKSNLVFFNQFGTIPTSNAVNKTLRELLGSLNIHRRNFHFHSLRHSHVALLLANGVDLYAISKRLGHSNISTTANVYAYLIDEYKDKTDKQILQALSSI
ncbi:tyrosine-type recombinase/integrase [Limosilactobacillus fastidiosus]|uniref:Site-specific integrase n=1 Tax=Limosilactobacillus fastidiosus TaxID=2759855 RepID=A0ABR6E8S1_9LACO|nr:site-specific integrase [Limosilactobacillus fastidiosus]MBB1063594.1 site-specific integrase [Limosilactobacillus fastidiosus]MCD7084170.1 site-specific integrase [Limosilactobacillus fastidiosus]